MKRDDIRLYNLFFGSDKATAIALDAAGVSEVGNGSTDFHPIPITTEWLLKLGFQKNSDGLYIKKPIGVYIDEIKGKLYFTIYKVEGGFRANEEPVLYVHELQNIFFDFTGESLIK